MSLILSLILIALFVTVGGTYFKKTKIRQTAWIIFGVITACMFALSLYLRKIYFSDPEEPFEILKSFDKFRVYWRIILAIVIIDVIFFIWASILGWKNLYDYKKRMISEER